MSQENWLGVSQIFDSRSTPRGNAEKSAAAVITSIPLTAAPRVHVARRWTDWEADSLVDEDEDLSGDMFNTSLSPSRSPPPPSVSAQLSCEKANVEAESEKRPDIVEKTESVVSERQKEVPKNVKKPAIVIDLIESPRPKARSSVWLSCRKKKQTRLDHYLRPSSAARATHALRVSPWSSATAREANPKESSESQPFNHLQPTQAPAAVARQTTIDINSSTDATIDINSSIDETPIMNSCFEPSVSHVEPEAVQLFHLDATVGPLAAEQASMSSLPLERTIAPSPLDNTVPPESFAVHNQNTTKKHGTNTIQQTTPKIPAVSVPSRIIISNSFIEHYDDFELPPREGPKPGEVVRNKKARAQLHGYECMCCKDYYDGLNLSPKSRQARIDQVSRHRGVQMMPMTPENYWEVDFPSTQECIRRGYIQESPYVRRDAKWRRKRTKKTEDD